MIRSSPARSGVVGWTRVGLGVVALCALAALAACDAGGSRAPDAAGDPFEVVLRLTAPDFGLPADPHHGVMAPIGEEARAALVAPRSEPVASLTGRVADPDGVVRAPVELPEAVRGLPESAFTLEIQRMPAGTPPELLEAVAHETARLSVREGWHLERGEGTSATLVFRDPDAEGRNVYDLQLRALAPAPLRLESRSFDTPAHGRLELAYGLAQAPDPSGREDARFQATLDCDGEPALQVLDATVGPGEGRWRDVSVALPEQGGSCRLRLAASDAAGAPVRGAVWGVPRVLRAGPPAADAPNLVLISLDTLRADHLSGFGYPRNTSPRIDLDLISRGTTFRDVTSTFSRTDVSHMSVFTGVYPEARPQPGRLAAGTPLPTLAERLRAAGFETAAFTEDGLLAGVFGFWFGFDRYTERAYRLEARGVETFAEGIEYLRTHRDRRFFLFLHTYKTHAPYAAGPVHADLFRDPADWERPELSRIPPSYRAQADEYDRSIRDADDLVGAFFGELTRLGLADRTFVVLFSDHGEAFGEHGLGGHSFSPQQEVMHVPLVVRGPGVPARLSVDTPVSLVDLMPTVLDLLGLEPPSPSQGTSLVPALRGGTLPEMRPLHFSWLAAGAEGVRFGPYKYERSRTRRSLFRIDEDPHEQHPLGKPGKHPLAERMLADQDEASARIRAGLLQPGAASEVPAVPEDVERSLRALGYVK